MSPSEFIVKDAADIGSFIKDQRKEMDVTQEDLANYASLSRVGVVKIEKKEGDIKLSTLLKIANLLGFEIVLKKRSNK
jgi:transcriptional regulator with XRE-family HTH domain